MLTLELGIRFLFTLLILYGFHWYFQKILVAMTNTLIAMSSINTKLDKTNVILEELNVKLEKVSHILSTPTPIE